MRFIPPFHLSNHLFQVSQGLQAPTEAREHQADQDLLETRVHWDLQGMQDWLE